MVAAVNRSRNQAIKSENKLFPWFVDGLPRVLDDGPLLGVMKTNCNYNTTPSDQVWRFDETNTLKGHCVPIVGIIKKQDDDNLPIGEQLIFKGVVPSRDGDDSNRIILIHSTSVLGFYAPIVPALEPHAMNLRAALEETIKQAYMRGKYLVM